MEKIIYSWLISILISSIFIIFLLIIGVKIKNIIVPFFLVLDLGLFFFYRNDIIKNNNISDLFYIYSFYAFSAIICALYSSYIFITKRSGRCVCGKCRNPDYEEIKAGGNL